MAGLEQHPPHDAAPPHKKPTPRRPAWRRIAVWAGAVLVLLAGAYLLAGRYLVPRLLRDAAQSWAQDTLHKPIQIGEIAFDPLRFSLDVRDLAVPQGPQPMLAADLIHVRFSILSVLHGPYTFSEVRLERPVVRAVLRPDRSLNLGDLAPKTPSKPSKRAVRIADLTVVGGEAAYADESLPGRPETVLKPVAFTLKDFQTNTATGGGFSLHGRSALGESVVWSGRLATTPLQSQGRLQITALRAETVAAFLGGAVPATLETGQVDFATAYDLHAPKGGVRLDLTGASLVASGVKAKAVTGLPPAAIVSTDRAEVHLDRLGLALAAGKVPDFQASLPTANLTGLDLAAPGQAVHIGAVTITGVSLESAARHVGVGGVVIDKAQLTLQRAPDGRLSLASFLAAPEAAPAAKGVQPPSTALPWTVHLERFGLSGATLRFDDAAVTPATHFVVTPINLQITDVDSDLTKSVGVHLDARMGQAAFTLAGSATPAKNVGRFKVALSRLPLAPLAAYGPRLRDAILTSGELSVAGQAHVAGADPKAFAFDGQAGLDKLVVIQPSTNSPLVTWDAFQLRGLHYDAHGATVENGVLTTPMGRVVVMPDRTLNLAAVAAPADPVPGPVVAAPKVAAVSPQAPPAPPLPFTLKRLEVRGGTMDFADMSIDPNFSARIEALEGSLTNISNRPEGVSDIDLSGQVIDRFSPVTIKGAMDLFAFDRKTDMHLAFRNIELPLFNPYSGRYAGYAIAKGKLTTELDYKIEDRKLTADHHVTIDQLQWGAASDSKEKAPFPARLATALLKDKNGVIKLDVPVTGSLDDPKFRVWPIVWQILGNIVDKAVTAPFRLIGGLFAGAEKAQFVDFDLGSASLPPDAQQALGALGQALAQRPELTIDIPAGPALPGDAAAIADQRLDAAIANQGKPAAMASLSPDQRLDRLKALYKASFHEAPAVPKPEAPAAGTAPQPKLTAQQRADQASDWLRDRLRPSFAPSASELQAMGAARASAVREVLLAQTGVDPTQVFMTSQAPASSEAGRTRLTLKLQ